MVSVDCYLNETTRHADVILPPPPVTTRGHHDVTLAHFQIRNVARYTPPLLDLADGEMAEWQILLRLAAIAKGTPDRPVGEIDDEVAAVAARRAANLVGCETGRVMDAVAGRRGPQRLLDLRLRSGPYGDRFGLGPPDAAEQGLVNGDRVAVTSKVTTVTAELRIDDTLRPGVVSMPHGWGHDGPGLRTSRSASVPGSNYNALVDDTTDLEALTASPIFNGVPVTVTRTSEEHP